MRRLRNLLATCLLATLVAHPTSAAGASPTFVDWRGPSVVAFLDALDHGDEAAMGRVVTASDADPVAIAYGVWLARREASGGLAAAAPAARAVVRAARHGPAKADLAALVDAWIAYGDVESAREDRLAGLAVSAERLRIAKASADLRTALDAARGDLAAAPRSPAAVMLRMLRVAALQGLAAEPSEIVAAYDASVVAALAVPWPERAAEILESWAAFERRRGRVTEGLALLDRAIEGGAERLSPASHARLRARRADELVRLKRFEEAIVEARASADVSRTFGDRAGVAGVLGTEARAFRGMRRLAEARDAGERARREALVAGSAREAVRSLVLLALLMNDAGRLPAGLSLLEQALAEAERFRAPDILSHVLTNLGQTEAAIGYVDAAIEHLSRALEIRRKEHDAPGAMAAAMRLAETKSTAGRPDEAERDLRAVADEATRLGLPQERGLASWRIGSLRLLAGDLAGAIASSDAAVAALEEAGSPAYVQAPADACAAEALLRLGRLPEGLARARKAVDRSSSEVEARRGYVRTILALALLRSGDAPAALAELRSVLDVRRLAAAGGSDADPENAVLDVRRTTELAVRAALSLPPADAPDVAFPFIEAGRACVLEQALVQRDALLSARLPLALQTEERASRDGVRDAMEALARVSRGRGSGVSEETARARAGLDAADRRRTDAIARIGREARNALELLEPPRPSLAGVRSGLREDEAYLAFHVAGDGVTRSLVAFVATRRGAALVDLGDAAAILDKASAWIDLASAPGSREDTLAASLYDRLLRPLEPLLGGVERWIVSPDGVLSFLPWGALRRVDGPTSERLVERVELDLVPSAGVLRFLREQPAHGKGRGVLAVADPTPGPGGKSLPASREEIAAISELYPADARTALTGDEATIEALRARLDASRGRLAVVHVATHGAFDPARPRTSGLVFAKGDRLFFDDVAALRVDADLAVLSGCETAKGEVRGGEGVLGLVRAFFLAGCPRVVASSWRVSDASTRDLMVRFHERMAKDGDAPGAALRAAQLDRLRAGGERAHPYHWAAFQAWGLPD